MSRWVNSECVMGGVTCGETSWKARYLGWVVVAALICSGWPAQLCMAQDTTPRLIDRIPPGTVVFDEKDRGFSHLIMFVKGRLATGDLKSVTENVRYYGDLFNLVYMANVARGPEGFELQKLAVGFSTKIKDRDVVVTSASAKELGAGLSMIGRSVLSGNEKALEEIVIAAQNKTSAVIDAPAVINFQGKHQKMLVRFFVWVSSSDGKVGTVVWLLKNNGQKYEVVTDSQLQYLPPGYIEDRALHVDGSKFTLGIPSADAFAMENIPQGKPFAVTERFKVAGAQPQLDAEGLKEVAASLAEALNQR